jgi:hypothetical protein
MHRKINVKVYTCTARLAFSHLPLQRLLKAEVPILMKAMQLPPGETPGQHKYSRHDAPRHDVSAVSTFRQGFTMVHVDILEASLWVCNDGQHSFGAPDILQVSQ